MERIKRELESLEALGKVDVDEMVKLIRGGRDLCLVNCEAGRREEGRGLSGQVHADIRRL
jgi:hypothetical protein